MYESIFLEPMVIVEYCRFGNIYQYLRKHRDRFRSQVASEGLIDYDVETTTRE